MKEDHPSFQTDDKNANANPSSLLRGTQLRPVARGGFRAKPRLSCPFCGKIEASPTNLWRHKAACEKNPNPTCAYCSRHYTDSELPRHEQRCEYRPTPDDVVADAEPDAPEEPEPAAPEQPEVEPEPAPEPTRIVMTTPTPRTATAPQPTPAPERVTLDPALASVAIHAAEINALGESGSPAKKPARSLGAALSAVAASFTPAQADALRLMLHMKREQDLRDTREAVWGALIVGGAVVGIILLFAYLDERPKAAQPTPAATSAAPQTRPPYNPTLHGSLEAYRAAYNHLPAPTVGLRDTQPPGVGLDRSTTP
ncbi:MAG: hypothetical protein QOE90_577 [Thermoplasmata archaeon]|jgi:hypothetical protein|nr:hypothetical protein [Thermoplasmata archaeon]